jgi:hypothetical protein
VHRGVSGDGSAGRWLRVIGFDDVNQSRDTRGEQVCELMTERVHQDAVNGGLA